jgi:hypothetical protein
MPKIIVEPETIARQFGLSYHQSEVVAEFATQSANTADGWVYIHEVFKTINAHNKAARLILCRFEYNGTLDRIMDLHPDDETAHAQGLMNLRWRWNINKESC